jgi:hypothetical protein
MNFGFDRPLHLLPFDHRESFKTRMFGWQGPLTEDQARQIAAAKQVIYEGFTAAIGRITTVTVIKRLDSSTMRSCKKVKSCEFIFHPMAIVSCTLLIAACARAI